VDGKARLVKESYCDGLGDCIGPCSGDAISFEERKTEPFDGEAARRNLPGGCRDHVTVFGPAVSDAEGIAAVEPGSPQFGHSRRDGRNTRGTL